MNIAIIDADIIGKKKHRFPNLCCMKISSYHKNNGDTVQLKLEYNDLDRFDKVYISKVFTDTCIPGEPDDKTNKTCDNISAWYAENPFLKQPNITYGGTGFFYDHAPPLPDYIEHIMPDYHLYDDWINQSVKNGAKQKEFAYYTDYSIGYLTRGCFRGCEFCVNRNHKRSVEASPLYEFLDESRPKICLLDDNFFSYPHWKELIQPVVDSGKRFQFRQGLDERLLTKEKIITITQWKYDGDMIFAFDNIEDKELIESNLKLFRETAPDYGRRLKFYVFCGCDKTGRYDEMFYKKDIHDLFERIEIISKYDALPYVMRYERVYQSEFSTIYAAVAAWCNQPSIFRSFSFCTFCKCWSIGKEDYKQFGTDTNAYLASGGKKGKAWREMERVERLFPDIANQYFNLCGGKSRRNHETINNSC